MDNQTQNRVLPQFPSETPNNHNYFQEVAEIEELRRLLLGLDGQQIQQLYELLNQSTANPEAIARLLPEAVRLRSQQDGLLGKVMVSTVEQAIQLSVDQNVEVLSGAIFPIVVPATRKAVANTLGEMIQSLNQALEHSLSPQSLQWRLEAKRTGKSFAEIVLLRTLVYRVEQVFLIHRHTGLLLKHLFASEVTTQDPDLVSAMLTAIQDFMRDSFRVDQSEGLQSLQFGELTIWVEASPHAVLAGIIRGNAPLELRSVFQTALGKIHLQFNRALLEFDGDTQIFEGTEYLLKPCLEARYKKQANQRRAYALGFLGLIAIALGYWGFLGWRSHLRWENLLTQIRNQPGFVITKAEKGWGKHVIEGMRDPLAGEINQLIADAQIAPQSVVTRWKPFISLEPEMIGKRVAARINPPSSVQIDIDSQGKMTAKGFAPKTWINNTREIWSTIPGINGYDDSQVQNLDIERLNQYKSKIEQEVLLFVEGSTQLLADQEGKFNQIQTQLREIYQIASQLNYQVRLEITGHTDSTGNDTLNQPLSQNRARAIATRLINGGIDPKSISISGVGSQQPVEVNQSQIQAPKNRRVTFNIFLTPRQ